MERNVKILAVDDNSEALFALEQLLKEQGYKVETAGSGKETLEKIKSFEPEVVLLDIQMPAPDGYEITKIVKSDPKFKYTIIVLLSGKDNLEDVVFGLDQGADDYIKKPFKAEELTARLRAAMRLKATYADLQHKEKQILEMQSREGQRSRFADIIGSSRAMQEVFSLIEKVADSDVPVLISGESGTGKELVARALHYQSSRKNKMFVVQNCSAFNDNLLESELFGHSKGAFTGAVGNKEGLFEIADGGTFFLDELGEMSAALQAKLLRVLQEGSFMPVGSTKTKQVDVRVVGATHRNLTDMIAKGTFREDLYYRLNVVNIKLPALRERREDIPELIDHFLLLIAQKKREIKKSIDRQTLDVLSAYSWPGNIRELQNEIEKLVLLSGQSESIDPSYISQHIRKSEDGSMVHNSQAYEGSLKEAIEEVEKKMLLQVLTDLNWNKSEAAKKLGISRSNLISKVQEYGLEK